MGGNDVDDTSDVAIVGSGIAGLTAALTSARLGRTTLVVGGELLGGELLSIGRVDGFPGFPEGVAGYDLCPMVQEQASDAGAEFIAARLAALTRDGDVWQLRTAEGAFSARAVILASGANLKELGVPGESRLRGKGVSHSASCDGPFMRGKTVAVVGGGDSALQEALTLAEFAAQVLVLVRGGELRAQAAYRAAVAGEPKIELRYRSVVEEIAGETGVTSVRVRDPDGTADVAVAGVFVYIGLAPDAAYLNGLLERDADGRIPVDGSMRTQLDGLFAAGAVRSGWGGRAAISAGDGACAALSADAYLTQRMKVEA